MTIKQPLARRILLSFTLLTALVAGVYAAALVAVIHVVEEDLIGEELRSEMAVVEELYRGSRQIPDISGSSSLYVPDLDGKTLPLNLSNIHEGYQEIVTASGAWHVLETSIDGHRFILVRNQDAFEARERLMVKVVVAGLALAIALAFVIGRLTVRRVIDPVIRLAGQVRERDRMPAPAPALAEDYGDDELGQLARAFDLAFGRLGAAIERERLFTSDVSHELRTPLMIVGTSAELLLARGDLPQQARRQVERIGKAAAEMRSLVDTFLQLARAQGISPTCVETTTLAALAEELAAAWRPEIAARGLGFVLRHDGEVAGHWHATLLRVVIDNLLRNALHYTERGEIRLIVGAGGFCVEDSGPGIPADEIDKLFEPFVRGQLARGEGLGLGLSLVRRICEQQGWRIAAGNLDGGGSCFSVRLG
ncbi:MAG: HAMP domain-containing histidine kinase [Betaproteobacteria bacterium]|nr:HAMP domain-containing histidine kinase [Betaproteobacteria bacterium]MCL2885685.1 HAMP domain-containing histidine kinase [Betaproteobacteria bacterium]